MFCRYVINKINHRTSCYQGVLITLGTMKHKGQLSPSQMAEVESIFKVLNRDLPTPPDVDKETFRNSVSWFKKNSNQFDSCAAQMTRAALVLRRMGHEILLLEANQLKEVIYEDSDQVLVKAGFSEFRILSLNP